MSKDEAIANIVKDLNLLSLEENNKILKYINQIKEKKKQNTNDRNITVQRAAPIHEDRDGTPLAIGDKVYLLTRGVNNKIGQEGIVHWLPKKKGEFILFFPLQEDGSYDSRKALHKKGRSVRKKPSEDA